MVAAGNEIRASDINNLVRLYNSASTAPTTWAAGAGNVRQNVVGLTFDVVTINPNAIVDVSWFVDVSITTLSAGGNMQFRLEVDGVAQTPLAIYSSSAVARGTCAAGTQVLHAAPGTYTYQISGIGTAAAIGAAVGSGLATMRALAWDLAA